MRHKRIYKEIGIFDKNLPFAFAVFVDNATWICYSIFAVIYTVRAFLRILYERICGYEDYPAPDSEL